MKSELEKLSTDYIANRDAVQQAFRWDNRSVYSVCANIFCASGRAADAAHLKECRKVIQKQTRPFSKFRGKTRPILSSMLAIGESPEERMAQANHYYRLLRHRFRNTEYLVLTAFLLTDLAGKDLTEEKLVRGKTIFRMMNRKHRLLTNNTDSVFAMLLAFSEKTEEELTSDIEACYRVLKTRFSSSCSVQTASQVLTMSAGTPEEKAQRVIDLYNALLEADVKYGRSGVLAPLAALSLADAPVPALVEEIKAVDEFLKAQKGYGTGGADREERSMHAVMIVSDQYTGTNRVNTTVMTNTLDMLISKQKASMFSLFLNILQFAAKLIPESQEKAEKTGVETQAETEADKQPEQ